MLGAGVSARAGTRPPSRRTWSGRGHRPAARRRGRRAPRRRGGRVLGHVGDPTLVAARATGLRCARPLDTTLDKDLPRGPDGVPGEGALRQARSADHPRHRGHHAGGGQGRRRGARRRAWSRPRSRPAAAARPAASSWPRPPTRPSSTRRTILGMQIKGLTVNRVLVTPATPPEEEYYFSFLLDRSNRQYLCIASVEGGVEIEEVAKTNPDAVKKIAIDPGSGVDEEKARAIVDEAKFPAALTDQAVEMVLEAVAGLRRGGRHAGRGQPAGPARGRRPRGARRQGVARRQRRLPARGPRGVRDQGRDRPARGQGQGEGPQLRQARRRGRHHRQRRRAGHVDPRRRRVRRRGARRRQAGQLPRHRRRRQRRR